MFAIPAKSHADDELFIAMTECKSKDVTARFVRDVKAAPEPALVLATDQQLDDVVRFATSSEEFCVVTVDPTFNLGDFDVTPLTYRHLLLETVRSGNQPVFLGPILIHYRKTFSTYLYFASTLIGLRRDLEKLQSFGTDGELALVDAFSHEFGYATHLSCAIHLRRNVKQQLQDRKFPEQQRKATLDEIFGTRKGTVYVEGLIDSKSCEEFDIKLASLESVWGGRELGDVSCTPGFHSWFLQHKADVLKCSAIRPVREKAGLGSPPELFTTNASESLNSVIKSKVDYEKSELIRFIDKMKCLVDDQQKEVERAVCCRGKYRFRSQYRFLEVDEQRWFNMTPESRLKHLAKVHKQELKATCTYTEDCEVASASASSMFCHLSESRQSLSVQLDSLAGRVKTPLVVLEGIWKKATEIVNDPLKISPAPGCSPHARMVESKTGKRPHLVTSGKGGKFMCDADCPNYKSFGICSHVVSTAEVNHMLSSFIGYHKKQNPVPNISALAKAGMPTGRGRKGGEPARKRKKMSVPESRVPFNPTSQDSPQSGFPSAGIPFDTSNTPSSPPPLRPSTQPPLSASVPFARINNVNTQGVSGNVFVSQAVSQAGPAAPSQMRPFKLHFIRGNISRCAGCKGLYTKPALPPHDLCVQHEEWRQITFPNSLTPNSVFSNVYYHASVSCIQVNWPTFLPQYLTIPPDVSAALLPQHKSLLTAAFGIH